MDILTDVLDRVRLKGADREAAPEHRYAVIAGSALKRAYRDILVGDRRDVCVVYLKGERELIARRVTLREGHFMPPSLFDSQFATLQEPGEDERPIVVSIDARPHDIVNTVIAKLGLATAGGDDRGRSKTISAAAGSSGRAAS
jgi:carbohydrate kinase (thermoresistant glucokinase family)